MDRKTVVSSLIHSVGYDADAQTLEVKFNSGKVFSYAGVPMAKAAEMTADDQPSVGKYFNAEIKNQYEAAAVNEGGPTTGEGDGQPATEQEAAAA